MTDLSPGTRHIVSSGLRALEPSQAARDRIRAAVAARVSALPGTGGAGESGPSGASTSAATGGMGAIVKASLLALVGAVVVGGGFIWFAGGDEPAERAKPAVATPAQGGAASAAGPAAEPAPPAPAPAAATQEDRPAPPAAHVRKAADRRRDGAAKTPTATGGDDDLAREVRLLDRARRALAAGDVDAAHDALARYRREIAAPQMERESLLLRAEAQCAAAESDDGLRTLAAVERRWPGASGVDAVRALCRGEAP